MTQKQKGAAIATPFGRMVGVGRVELPTPAMSIQCSTTELYARTILSLSKQQERPLALVNQPRKRVIALEAIKGSLAPDLRKRVPLRVRDRAGGTAWTAPWRSAVHGLP